MELGDNKTLKALTVQPGSVYRMRFYPSDGVTPKNAGDTFRDKYFVILGKDAEGNYVALSLINTEINDNLKSVIGPWQYSIAAADYGFLKGKDRFVDCYKMKETGVGRIVSDGEYIGIVSENDLEAIKKLVVGSPVASVAKMKQYGLL
ncbi:MAG: hypothetical protein IJK84_10870 [Bacteroidales bacterium]|nr:hypothetical protein [Bacteroidales bacterium]MBQ7512644.1 hypothetical protein [Prevotella sp.]